MNERILELARQVWPDPNTSHVNHKKFAELIVRECAGKVDFILREKSNGGGTMGDEIREHFGVEE
jgi:hypothetical protein